MERKICEETLAATTKCPREFACLQSEDSPLCRPVDMVEDLLFVSANGRVNCPYALHFGDGIICKCPVRLEIYKQYRC